jgi:uncharacterized SAM-dependent methyltransferase
MGESCVGSANRLLGKGDSVDVAEDDRVPLMDRQPSQQRFCAEVLGGLRKPQKELPPKYFYDERGSGLFECITKLPGYYIPRTEMAIMKARVQEIAGALGDNVLLVEPGCGDCVKTRVLLDHLPNLAGYVPIDISYRQLVRVVKELASSYPLLDILPVCADYTDRFELPRPKRPGMSVVVFFPGSTIGNFEPPQARHYLEDMAGSTALSTTL